ncbi:MAG: DUF4132 domain-containing protein [Armatimonadota bacterium]|nr:MAG: DUF4132 domain-containing protein [Armatimonadota bacterium]
MTQRKRSKWQKAQAIIEDALDEMRLPASYWQRAMPTVVQDWMRRASGTQVRSRLLDAFDELISRLDREAAGWEQSAADLLLGPPTPSAVALWRPVAALLGGRRLQRPDGLSDAVAAWSEAAARGEDLPWHERRRGEQCVLALVGTDTTATLAMWRGVLPRLSQAARHYAARDREPDPALFLVFLKLLQHRLLSYDEFADAARCGGAFHPAHYSGRRAGPPFYQPVLDSLGLTRSRYFRLMYQRLAHEQTDPDRAGRWEDVWWLRMLSGRDYFFRALEELEADPSALHALHAAKWGFDFGERGPDLSRRLSAFAPQTLALVSLLRDDLDREIGEALDAEAHAQAMAWLRTSAQAAWALAVAAPDWLVEWCARSSEVVADAVEKLWLLGLPPMISARSLEMLRDAPDDGAVSAESQRYVLVERFVSAHLCPGFTRVSLNLDYADALAGRNEDALIRRAHDDTVSAIRALGLLDGDESRLVAELFALKKRGNRSTRAAAEDALMLVARRHGLTDTGELERRKELALAWSDAGLEGHRSKVWWNIGDYRVRLSAAHGKVKVTVYGRRGPLKTIPKAVREHPDFEEISDARRELAQQYAEFRKSLEESMVTSRVYAASELTVLRSNPVFDDLSERLVLWVGQEVALGRDAAAGPARVAHPVELLNAGLLESWQHRIFDERIVQPFKQCFREVYRPLPDEANAGRSARFAGHQVLVPRAFALLRSRGYSPGRGEARRDWPHARMQAHFTWGRDRPKLDYHLGGEGRAEPVTTGDVAFYRLLADGKRGEPVAIGEVPPLVYSETMRDADLVVSLATAGELGFTSDQTVQFRRALARQLARILELHNVAAPEEGSYVVVQGRLATYRVHLGSASVFIEPTGAHLPPPRRPTASVGFLPFEDVDSGTAEVLRVITALSRDDAIEDEQFRECLARLAELTRPQ